MILRGQKDFFALIQNVIRLTSMMLVLNIEFVKIRPCGVCSNKEQIKCSTAQTNPRKYPVHPTLFRHTPSYVRITPGVGFVRTVENLTLTYFSDYT